MRRVVTQLSSDEVRLDEVTTSKGYVMAGDKANFILSKDTKGKFIWVRVTPGKIGKPVHTYNTMDEAIKDKLNNGYEVFEYEDAVFS
jgi:hypothetical protein